MNGAIPLVDLKDAAELGERCPSKSVFMPRLHELRALFRQHVAVVVNNGVVHFPLDTQKSSLHPTQKPVALMAWVLRHMPDGVVLDPYMGSGSTGVAAAQMGLRFVGVEAERRYFDIACERIEAIQRQGRLSLPDAPQAATQAELL